MSHIKTPTFALLGLPNSGKTTLVSTLSFNPNLQISHISGNTTRCEQIDLRIDGSLRLQFIDTPGVQYAEDMYAWFKAQPDHNKACAGVLAKRFYHEHCEDEDFRHECELMKCLQEDVSIIYIADPTHPPSSDDECLIEVLRMCNNYRVSIINMPDAKPASHVKEWDQLFRRDFNATHKLNGISADFHQILRFLSTLKSVNQDWYHSIEETVELLDAKRKAMLDKQAGLFVSFISDIVLAEVSVSDVGRGNRRSEEARLAQLLKEKIQALEDKYQKQTLQLFQLKNWVELSKISRIDAYNEDIQRIWGLSPWAWRLSAIGGGAATGAAIDLFVGGLSFGTGAVLGGMSGLALTFIQGTTEFVKSTEGLKAHIPLKQNLHWSLFNKALVFTKIVAQRAHGNREHLTIDKDYIEEHRPELSFCQTHRELISATIKNIKENNYKLAAPLEESLIQELVVYLDT